MSTYLSSSEIRETFLDFFAQHDHKRITGASLLPKDDPTLLFINSGMAPLKPYFTGAKSPPHPDLCNVQPCIRTTDIDDVGDRHHLTFFEMLGSWSIGHYFKERAIELAYGLLVDRFGFDSNKLYVSVYSGNPAIGLEPDHETARAWERVGIKADRIVFLGEDNFWGPAGDTGPCGPCTEVFFDTGDEYGAPYTPGGVFDTKKRYIEIWNAGVFMQLDKKADGTFEPLPFRSVDTGSGLERMAFVLQSAPSVYETDIFVDLMAAVKEGVGEKLSVESCRILTDHVRASAFILAEGVAPGNTGRAYVPRRLIRKCVALVAAAGLPPIDYASLIDIVVRRFGPYHSLLERNREELTQMFLRETREFEAVIGRGLERLQQLCSGSGQFIVSGRDAFDLFSTFGLPIEVSREFVKERGGTVDDVGYAAEFRHHQVLSRGTSHMAAAGGTDRSTVLAAHVRDIDSRFVGYDTLEARAQVVALVRAGQPVDRADAGTTVELVASDTPFYAEGGGQVGDAGTLTSGTGAVLRVSNTRKVGGVHVHLAEVTSGSIRLGDDVQLSVDAARRRAIVANHSATHLLQSALREILGPHVRQAGSLVDPDKLRFDFEHPERVSPERLHQLERRINEMVREDHLRTVEITSYENALKAGALAFFSENYGDVVRLVRLGPNSAELCGGTHVKSTGEIGLVRIVSESSVASGVRRIIAVTAEEAVSYTLEQDRALHEVATKLHTTPRDVVSKVTTLLQKSAPERKAAKTGLDAKAMAVKLPNQVQYVAAAVEAEPKELANEALRVADAIQGIAVLAGHGEGKARLAVAISRDVTDRYNASRLLRLLLPYIDGRGGGSDHLAQGGGDGGDIDALLNAVPQHLKQM